MNAPVSAPCSGITTSIGAFGSGRVFSSAGLSQPPARIPKRRAMAKRRTPKHNLESSGLQVGCSRPSQAWFCEFDFLTDEFVLRSNLRHAPNLTSIEIALAHLITGANHSVTSGSALRFLCGLCHRGCRSLRE